MLISISVQFNEKELYLMSVVHTSVCKCIWNIAQLCLLSLRFLDRRRCLWACCKIKKTVVDCRYFSGVNSRLQMILKPGPSWWVLAAAFGTAAFGSFLFPDASLQATATSACADWTAPACRPPPSLSTSKSPPVTAARPNPRANHRPTPAPPHTPEETVMGTRETERLDAPSSHSRPRT